MNTLKQQISWTRGSPEREHRRDLGEVQNHRKFFRNMDGPLCENHEPRIHLNDKFERYLEKDVKYFTRNQFDGFL